MGKIKGIELCYPGKIIDERRVYGMYDPVDLIPVREFYPRGLKPLMGDNWKNMLIFGDSREVLRTLLEREEISGKVALVYTDPPYATGKVFRKGKTVSSSGDAEVAYVDYSLGPEYLEFIRHNLIFLRDVLSDSGSIYLHIGLQAAHYVKILMDEVFGVENFLNDIARVKSNPKNFHRKAYGNIRDSILFYSKAPRKNLWNDPREPYTEEDLERLFPKVDENGRRYTTVPAHAPGETKNGETGKPWKGMMPPKGRHWRYPPKVLDELEGQGRIEWSKNGVPRIKIYADEYAEKGKKMQDVWLNYKDPPYPEYPTQKNLEMVKKIIEASSNPGDIVLDAFCGSGTTAVAAELTGRRWICIDNSPTAIKVALKRILEVQRRPFVLLDATGDVALLQEAVEEVIKQKR